MMTPAKLTTLAIVTALAVAAAVVSVRNTQTTLTQADRGKSFLPDLLGKINEIDSITIVDGVGATEISKAGDGFIDSSGYPVRIEAVRNLLTGLSMLTIEERKTDQSNRYADLELAAPDATEGNGKQVILQSGGSTVADLVVGVRDTSVGGTRGGVFVRRSTTPPAYLLRGAVPLPGTRSGWFDDELYKLGKEKVLTAQVKPLQGQPIQLAQSESSKSLVLDNLPAGKSADPAKIQRIASLVAALSFEDVRKAKGQPSGMEISLVGDNKRRYVISPVDKFDAENTWVRISVKAESVKDVADANRENARFDGFEFKLSRYNAEPLNWNLADVLNKPKPAQPAAGPGVSPAMPGMPGLPNMPGMPAPAN